MKTLLTTVAVSALLVSGALAQSIQYPADASASAIAQDQANRAYVLAHQPSLSDPQNAVYGGTVMGRDSDPQVRQNLIANGALVTGGSGN
jgi:hypothetical protein